MSHRPLEQDSLVDVARDPQDQPERPRLRAVVPVGVIVLGLAGIAGTTLRRPSVDAAVVALTVFVLCLLVGIVAIALRGWDQQQVRFVAAIGAFGVIAGQAIPDPVYFQIRVFVITALAASILAGVALLRDVIQRRWALGLSAVAVVVVAAACLSVLGGTPLGIDVIELHEQAIASIQRGENPYTTGNVAVYETKPEGEQELIEEYTYPPISLAWYAIGDALNGDVRTGGAIALVVSVALFAAVGISSGDRGRNLIGTVAIAGTALLISNQAMYVMVSNAWTEVTVLPFFFVAVLWWRRFPVGAAVALGLAIASKQYLLLAVPILLVLPDPWRYKRTLIAVGTAAATFVPFLVWDARGLFDGLVVHHLTRDARPDGATWANLGVEIPTLLVVAVAIAFGVWVARRAHGPGLTIVAIGGAIGVFTLMAIRGFVNSWWLVYCLVAVGLLVPQRGTDQPAREGAVV